MVRQPSGTDRVPRCGVVLLARTNKIHEAPARLPFRMGAARPWPPSPSTARRDAPQPCRLHHVDGENKVKPRFLVTRFPLTILVSLCFLPFAIAQSVKFSEHKLKNGLRVILSEDHSAPTYSISVTYNVGSRDERDGRTGFAHLFEHMMFQGSENVGKGEHFIIIENNGGGMNGSTSGDRTEYHETLPANQIDLGLFLEADRMKSLAITPAN